MKNFDLSVSKIFSKTSASQSKNGIQGSRRNTPNSTTPENLITIDLDDLHDNPDQARSYYNEIEISAMATSMKRVGQLEPIHVFKREGKMYISSGHKRKRALKEAGISTAKAFIKEDNLISSLSAIDTNHFRSNIHPIDKGIEVLSILNHEQNLAKAKSQRITIEHIGEHLGYSPITIKEWIQFAQIDQCVRSEIVKRNIRCKTTMRKIKKIIKACKKIGKEQNQDEVKIKDRIAKNVLDYIIGLDLKSNDKPSLEVSKITEGKIPLKSRFIWREGSGIKISSYGLKHLNKEQKEDLLQAVSLLAEEVQESIEAT